MNSEFFDERSHNEFRAICADIKEVRKTNAKGSAKQKASSSPNPT
jgi:hypothetical protein